MFKQNDKKFTRLGSDTHIGEICLSVGMFKQELFTIRRDNKYKLVSDPQHKITTIRQSHLAFPHLT